MMTGTYNTAHAEETEEPEEQGGSFASTVRQRPGWVHAALLLVVTVHLVLVLANILAFFLLPFLTPWYVSVPLATLLFSFMTTGQECRLTNLENSLRQRLGKRKINGFVGHYLVRPVKRHLQPSFEPSREAC